MRITVRISPYRLIMSLLILNRLRERRFAINLWVNISGSIYTRQNSTTKCGVYPAFCLLLSRRVKVKRRTVSPDRSWSIFRSSLDFGYVDWNMHTFDGPPPLSSLSCRTTCFGLEKRLTQIVYPTSNLVYGLMRRWLFSLNILNKGCLRSTSSYQ